MDNEHPQSFTEQSEFIPEIYQYCDRWCERCPLTARCMNFALNRDRFGEFGLFDAHSLAFWQSLLDAFRAMREFLEEALKHYGLEITEADLSRMLAAFAGQPGKVHRAAAEDGTPGHPVIFPRRLFVELSVVTGDGGGRRVTAGEEVVLHPLPGQRALLDLDTPEDWADFRRS